MFKAEVHDENNMLTIASLSPPSPPPPQAQIKMPLSELEEAF